MRDAAEGWNTMTTRTADQIARSIANWNADDDTYSPIRNNVERDMIVAALSPPESTDAVRAACENIRGLIADLQGEHEVMCGPFDPTKWKIEVPVADLQKLLRAMPLQDGAKEALLEQITGVSVDMSNGEQETAGDRIFARVTGMMRGSDGGMVLLCEFESDNRTAPLKDGAKP